MLICLLVLIIAAVDLQPGIAIAADQPSAAVVSTLHNIEYPVVKDDNAAKVANLDAQEKHAAEVAAQEAAQAEQVAQARGVAAQQAAQAQAAAQVAVSDNAAMLFIFSHESGNNPGAINASSGACGLGQALPCSKMPCSLSDYACQVNFFTQYAVDRYGSWAAAYSFWVAHAWW